MSHNLLSFLEYGIMPFLLVIATVTVKYVTKQSARINWKEFLSIGLDILLMCSFALFIFGVSLYNHSNKNSQVEDIVLLSVISCFLLFIFSIILALLIRHWGESDSKSFWIQNILGVLCLILFLYFVSTTNETIGKAQPQHSEHDVMDNTLKDTLKKSK